MWLKNDCTLSFSFQDLCQTADVHPMISHISPHACSNVTKMASLEAIFSTPPFFDISARGHSLRNGAQGCVILFSRSLSLCLSVFHLLLFPSIPPSFPHCLHPWNLLRVYLPTVTPSHRLFLLPLNWASVHGKWGESYLCRAVNWDRNGKMVYIYKWRLEIVCKIIIQKEKKEKLYKNITAYAWCANLGKFLAHKWICSLWQCIKAYNKWH